MADQENFDDHSVKEIASLLGLSPAQIDKALQQAIQKLQSPELQEDLRSLAETAQCLDSIQHDNTPYLTYNYTMAGLAPHDIEELDVKDINSILGEKK
jgi:multidrug efflux pump subunit AcrB